MIFVAPRVIARPQHDDSINRHQIHVKNRLHSYPRCPNRAPELFHVELRARYESYNPILKRHLELYNEA